MIVRIIIWVLISCGALNFLGFAVDHIWLKHRWYHTPGYFELEIVSLGNFPYWFLATLTLLALNGIFLAHLGKIGIFWGEGRAGIELPHIRLLGQNFIFISILTGLYIFLSISYR